MKVESLLKFEEGERLSPYLCSGGYLTVGVGHKLCSIKGVRPENFFCDITPEQSLCWLQHDIELAKNSLWQHQDTRAI